MTTNPTEIDRTPEMDAELEDLQDQLSLLVRHMLMALGHVVNADDGSHQISLVMLALPMVRVPGMVLEDGTPGYAAQGTLLFSNVRPEEDYHDCIGTMLDDATRAMSKIRHATAN